VTESTPAPFANDGFLTESSFERPGDFIATIGNLLGGAFQVISRVTQTAHQVLIRVNSENVKHSLSNLSSSGRSSRD
jgi:hypothetical protein